MRLFFVVLSALFVTPSILAAPLPIDLSGRAPITALPARSLPLPAIRNYSAGPGAEHELPHGDRRQFQSGPQQADPPATENNYSGPGT
ncbi:uncharacterized protein EI90DRAFT_3073663 [Cantharellus anzutake]|uniref:uncharacterized protein n=1 Tax=Cantharellus anzutake TaxID=1750568 RepID=UPI0019071CB3|nr:uncharacterized protein EI90DRAFT_3073663 [Cantharellus anzutake]KAF8325270.1 hypothetical protein EI90DRAFT_3073663 [Cantharellus anzutake]